MAHHYDPHQPRVPAGHHDGGQWTHDSSAQVAQAQLALPAITALPGVAQAAITALAAAAPLFRWLSAQNSRDKHAILEFNAREYRKTEKGVLDLANARLLSREEVNDTCQRYKDVQDITNKAAKKVRDTQPGLSPSQYGTAVHTQIDRAITTMKDPT